MIYDLVNTDYTEMSLEKNSNPYQFISQKKYYFGFLNYFYQISDGIIKHVKYDNIYELSKFNDPNGDTNKTISTLNLPSTYEVPFSEYFKSLDGINNKFALNQNGDCGYVAASLLLSYFSNYYNAKLVCAEHEMYSKTKYDSNYKIIEAGASTIDFKKNVLEKNVSNLATIPTDVFKVLKEHLASRINSAISLKIDTTLSTSYAVMNIIKQGNPVLIFGDLNYGYGSGKHVVVGYGIYDNSHVICHTGHMYGQNVIVKSNYLCVIGGYVYINHKEIEHSHLNNTYVNDKPYCFLERSNVNKKYYISNSISSTHHTNTCVACNNIVNETHTFRIISELPQKLSCIECGFVKFDNGP